RNHANYSEADLVEVLSPSPHRIQAVCPLFGRCGGCQYQNLAYPEQLEWKRRQVAELLLHMAGLTLEVAPVIGSPRPFGYRSKITPHFNAPRPGQELAIGFLRQGTRFDIVDVPRCEIATEPINARLAQARAEIRRRASEGAFERGATMLFRDAGGTVTSNYDDRVTEEVPLGHGQTLRLGFLARDFFQNNPFILPAFAAYVRDQARLGGSRFLVDAYCGSGLFALASARVFERVVGVEVSESSVAFARENAVANGIANALFTAGDASAIFAGLGFRGDDTAVVIDPPRKGCDEVFLRQLFDFRPRSVVYVSCDPATQMRDLNGFLAAGYEATAVQPFDLFPQTRHLECVITLSRAGYCQGEAGTR
ncbi:MAG TPA: class I SAM-dependent RNA methyltransferase, partial [Opitutaceae bacterium]